MSVYEGKFPYIFISYAHKNNKAVMRVVEALAQRGYRIWFDEGITPGSDWAENIAQHLADAAAVIAFVTPESIKSPNFRREINFALSRNKPLLSIFLEKTELPLGMELQLAAQQSILRYNYRTEEEFLDMICVCELLLPCLIQTDVPFGGWYPPAPPEVRQSGPRPRGIGIVAAVVCALALLAGGLFFWRGSRSEKKSALPGNSTIRVEVPKETGTKSELPEETAAVHMMRPAGTLVVHSGQPFWGQTAYTRDQVETVQFRGSLTGAPGDAWDVSADGDRSILAWMDGSALYVAADGRISVPNAAYLFYGFENLKSIDWGGCFTTAGTTSMRGMFSDCANLQELDVSFFDTSRVTDMSDMFSGCGSLIVLDVSGFRTENVTNMMSMFSKCGSLTTLDVSGFRTGNVTNMMSMFFGCGSLTALDVSGFRTENVTNMMSMFYGCGSLVLLDVSGFRTENVTNMGVMFYGCGSLTALDVSGFRTENVTNMMAMFYGCGSLVLLDVSGFRTENVTTMGFMFNGCSSLLALDVSGFRTENVTSMERMFAGCTLLPPTAIPAWYTGEI